MVLQRFWAFPPNPSVVKWCDSRLRKRTSPYSSYNSFGGIDVHRDIRDPQAIGAALEVQRAHSPSLLVTELADRVLSGPLPNYGESTAAYRERVHRTDANGNGQLAMFRAA